MRYAEAEALAAENANRTGGPYYVICKAIPTAPAGSEYEACAPGKAWGWAQRDGWHLAAEILPTVAVRAALIVNTPSTGA